VFIKVLRNMPTALVTGSAGFIGFHVSKALLDDGWRVVGLDCLIDYYDVSLKEAREQILLKHPAYKSIRARLESQSILLALFESEAPEVVIHLAAQAGVRYSIDNPRAFVESNVLGTLELLEAARAHPPKHLLIASSSSVYGAEEDMPYREHVKADHQLSTYAATKKSIESLAHAYAHLFDLPTTVFRFFTVYGPWGRPDMAPFKFVKAVLEGSRIDVYNYGNMKRDFTYVDDLVKALIMLIDVAPKNEDYKPVSASDTLSPAAPYRLVNVGNNSPVDLSEFIAAIEQATDKAAVRNLMPIQPGDVPATWADSSLLRKLTGYTPQTQIQDGVAQFVHWYRAFYKV
jgi:UDP-glucuronate 4-epimerase